ncbi:MAG: IS66 family transposase, partial [Oligoflexia bacterium]|nr:IS66 family transposase [Oligoflexia bacterium]
ALFDKKSERLVTPDDIAPINNTSSDASEEQTAQGGNVVKDNPLEIGTKASPLVNDQNDQGNDDEENKKKEKKKGHGRKKATAYTGATIVNIDHHTLFEGDPCPLGCGAKVYKYDPGVYVRVTGAPLFSATVYQTQKYRCNGCQAIFEAELDKKVKAESKYDMKAIVNIAMAKFELGIPYHRLEQYQKIMGIPLPSSVQTEKVEILANNCFKIFTYLEKMAANSPYLAFDDTVITVLEYEKENKDAKNDKNFRKGYYASVIAAKINKEYLEMAPAIVLIYLDRNHAAKNFDELIKLRENSLPPPMVMSDAFPTYGFYKDKNGVIDLNCLTHARRRFFDIKDVYTQECAAIIGMIQKIYINDGITKEQKMSNDDRFEYHQANSRPILNVLMDYCEDQLEKCEPNGDLRDAIDYLLNHWNPITNFARVPGAMLDNNWIERLVKDIIKIRKNSLFFKTEMSSKIASIVLSIIETCKVCSVNSFHYLYSVMENQTVVKTSPHLFLPWNYQEYLQKKDANA